MRKILLCFCLILFFPLSSSAVDKQGRPELLIFHSFNCHECAKVKAQVIPVLQKEFSGKVSFVYLDVGEIANFKLLLSLIAKNAPGTEPRVPSFYMEGRFLVGEGQVEANLRNIIKNVLSQNQPQPLPAALKPVDPIAYFKSFVPLSVAVAGLEDGINPCAFTVIVFFISFLAVQGYRKRELFFIGFAFILSVFLTYLGIGLGIFNFFYRFGGVWAITHWFNLVVGLASILFGILAVYDFIEFKKTGSVERLILQLPKPIKERIHKVVGFFYRKDARGKKQNTSAGLGKLLLSAFITGFLVSLLEAVCTGQVYLPTIAFVLKASPLKLQALGYLLLYNLMFIFPLVVIFILALMGITSSQFSGFLKKHLGLIKILMAILFFALGIFLLWRF
jgi:cytochrome c biogenesis protein CcdA